MLKEAALLQLELLRDALTHGLTIKEATPFNIQFVEGRPLFIDVGSFEKYRPGEPWIGYRQFTRQFLFSLMLRAWVGVPFQAWVRGDMEGATASQMNELLSGGKRLKPSALMHVSLQTKMEDRMQGRATREGLKEAGFSSDLILGNVRKLHTLIESTTWDGGQERWSSYRGCDHVGRDGDAKSEFLMRALLGTQPRRVLDLGANDGHFSDAGSRDGCVGGGRGW